MLESEMQSVWDRHVAVVETFFGGAAPLNGPASDADIGRLESHIGVELHPEHRFMLQQANGSTEKAIYRVNYMAFISTDVIAKHHDFWLDNLSDNTTDGPIDCDEQIDNSKLWYPTRVFFFGNDDSEYDGIVCDMAPSTQGSIGQVYSIGHEFDVSPILAASPLAFLQRFTDQIEADGQPNDVSVLVDMPG